MFDNARPYRVKLNLTIPEDAPTGRHELMFRTPIGMSNSVALIVSPKPDLLEKEPNDTAESAQPLDWPGVVAGQINRSGDRDFYRVKAKSGQDLVAALTDSSLNASLRLLDATGTVVATSADFGEPRKRAARRSYPTRR